MNDNNNPYTPTSASLQDASRPERRDPPVAIVIAVVLQVIGLIYGLCWIPFMWNATQNGEMSGLMLLLNVVGWVVVAVLCVKIWRGRNWARIVLAAFTALSLVGLVTQVSSIQFEGYWQMLDAMQLLKMVLVPIIGITTMVLVYGPGREWFRPRAS